MEFKRDIYNRLLEWKNDYTGKVLEVSGARQVGKTYVLKKFANENFKHAIYINMAELTGERFNQCLAEAEFWKPGMPMTDAPTHEAIRLFYPEFEDSKNTIIVIDEIQESSRVYNLIRTFSREFSCYVVVTGSYLGRLLSKDFFLPAGDLDTMTLETLTFAEFSEVFGKREIYESVDLYGGSEIEKYDTLRECFDLYQRIGGYPSVISIYLEHKNLDRCDAELWRLMTIFINESKRYFDDVMETNAFESLFHGIAITLIREKQGVRDLVEDLSKIVYKEESGRFTKQMLNRAIGWLRASHIIAYAGKSIDCDYLNIKENTRFYFLDVGISRYFLLHAGADETVIKGIVAENFVYLALLRRIRVDIAGNSPWFAFYEKTKGELDFFVRSMKDHKNYGIEVKSTDAQARTARALFEAHKLDYVYYLKGGSNGGLAEEGRIITVPIYLADRISFDLG
ncbi:MAG: AAA family ATPase [Hungatella sp.]|nr:AAA family ATPase [Hungatella sp.]